MERYINIVFDAPPGPECGRFVEVEDSDGCSICAGDWMEHGTAVNPDGSPLWVLRIVDPRQLSAHRRFVEEVEGRRAVFVDSKPRGRMALMDDISAYLAAIDAAVVARENWYGRRTAGGGEEAE